MAGGMHADRGPGAPLWQRAAASQDARAGDSGRAGGADTAPPSVDAVPCWIDGAGPVAGPVLAWRRDPDAGWQAMVVAWLPAERVRRR